LNIRKFTLNGLDMAYSLLEVKDCAAFLKSKGIEAPVAGIVLGTGLGALVKHVQVKLTIPYSDIPGFPEATVEFHKGNLIYGSIGNTNVLVMQGRFHYYEGYSMQQVTFPVRVMKELGITYLLLSNAAGGMNPDYKKGDLVMLTDHINEQPENPLRGLNDPAFGNRFVDMCCPYDLLLNTKITSAAEKLSIQVKQGIYVAVAGPNLETLAEYRLLRAMGADMVGMSTVPEVIVANHVGLPCAAVSVITDECDPDNLKPVNISEIIAVAGKADEKLSKLFVELIREM
jgi:purine-nucleoside phosphorylase